MTLTNVDILTISKEAHQKLSEAVWRTAIDNGLKIANDLKPLSERTLEALQGLPLQELHKVATTPEGDRVVVVTTYNANPKPWLEKFSQAGIAVYEVSPRKTGEHWVTLARGTALEEKKAVNLLQDFANPSFKPPGMSSAQSTPQPLPEGSYSPTLTYGAEIGGYLPGGRFGWSVPGVPRHLQGMLASGIIGGAAGYGLGWLGSKILPNSWDKKRLPRSLATLGAVIGASPGAALAGINVLQGKSVFDDSPLAVEPISNEHSLFFKSSTPNGLELAISKIPCNLSPFLKQAISMTGYDVDMAPTAISIDKMNQNLFGDPRVYQSLSMPMRAATSGLLESAYALKDQGRGGPRFVTPMDIARISAGMGSGYLSGAIVGKALGALVGMPEETQDKLKNIGVFSGIIANVVPLIF
jgi:hypothetical protein